ncbi:MAG: serine protease [Symploca sp. SIO2E6]|nr:serine protease [Symploca sp. SIO2E6]
MQSWRCLSVVGTLAFLLVGCNFSKPLSPGEISQKIGKSVVLIYYKGGHGSGFFVSGEKGVCTILTARHVALAAEKLKIQTKDRQTWNAGSIRPFPHNDLALVEFTPQGNNCPYPSLPLGDSDQVTTGDQVYISGYFESNKRLLNHFVPGDVTTIAELPEGYGIAYDATTARGMSGGPVVNETGEIIAIHGRSDIEIYELAKRQGKAIPPALQALAEEDSDVVGSRTSVFKWGIPTRIYLTNLPKVAPVAVAPSLTQDTDTSYNRNFPIWAMALTIFVTLCGLVLAAMKFAFSFWLNRGNALKELGKYQDAIASFDKAIKIKPDDADAWHHRGNALKELGKYQDAIAYFDKAIKIKPDYADAWHHRGIALEELGKYQDAIASFDKAIEIKPDYADAWHHRGNALKELGKYQDAIASFDKAIEIKPYNADTWYYRGLALKELGKYQDAITSFEQAIKIKPDYADAWHNRGFVLRQLGRYQEAIASCDKAIKIKPDYADAWNNRGIMLKELGKNQEAIASFEQALKIKPDDTYAKELLKELGR